MSDSLISSMYAVGNVASSVALVLLNKRVFAGGFYYPMTLSCFHFAFTIIFYQLLAAFDVFKKPAIDMPQTEKFKVAFAGFASIGFMNLSLTYNSVGFYQVAAELLSHPHPSPDRSPHPDPHADPKPKPGPDQVTKLVMVPVTLVINSLFYDVTTNGKVKLSLLLVRWLGLGSGLGSGLGLGLGLGLG